MMKRDKVKWLDMKVLSGYDDLEYLLYKIYFHCAPTIMGTKPSTLMAFNASGRDMAAIWDQYSDIIRDHLPLEYQEVNRTSKGIAILFFYSDVLYKHLSKEKENRFLKTYDYQRGSLNAYIGLLRKRFQKGCPHELGVFLGYPVEDIKTYMEDVSAGCPLIGYWKAYHNLDKALETFCEYDDLRNRIVSWLESGYKPSKLHYLVAA